MCECVCERERDIVGREYIGIIIIGRREGGREGRRGLTLASWSPAEQTETPVDQQTGPGHVT